MATLRIGKLFHLTPLVDDLDGAVEFFTSVFAPLVYYRGYAAHWHREASLMAIADSIIEPLLPLPPADGAVGTSWFRYMESFGPRVHNVAIYCDDLESLAARLDERGVRYTDAGVSTTLFIHPKDSPGMLEFSTSTWSQSGDPRFSPRWDDFARDYWAHRLPLGLERLSHITTVVRDRDAAREFYTGALDAVVLPEQPGIDAATSHFVVVGEGVVFELAEPSGPGRPADELERCGEGVIGVTFKVRDLDAARTYLANREAGEIHEGPGRLSFDASRTWGCEYAFGDRALEGDRRQ
ncbi:MAG TPA: VOC family protein [Acidimicrobiales bacterium]|nr:VOC family protein [Acidimicrobiales bacterium]